MCFLDLALEPMMSPKLRRSVGKSLKRDAPPKVLFLGVVRLRMVGESPEGRCPDRSSTGEDGAVTSRDGVRDVLEPTRSVRGFPPSSTILDAPSDDDRLCERRGTTGRRMSTVDTCANSLASVDAGACLWLRPVGKGELESI